MIASAIPITLRRAVTRATRAEALTCTADRKRRVKSTGSRASRYARVVAAEDIEVAERFREALEAAVRTGDREPVYELLVPDVEWVTPQRTLHGIEDMRENWTWGASPETFDYEFEEGGWADDGQGQLVCDVRQVYRLKETGDFAYERTRRVQLTLRQGRISRYEMKNV
jgi:hypothetical protein